MLQTKYCQFDIQTTTWIQTLDTVLGSFGARKIVFFLCSNSFLLFFLFLLFCFIFYFHILFHYYPNLIWFLFSSLFQDIIKGNTFTNYNTTFNFSMTHIFKLVKPQFFLFFSGREKSLLSHVQQWDLKSTSEKEIRMEENWSLLFILNINY